MTDRPSQRLTRDLRLRHVADFERVYLGRAYAADNVLVVNAAGNDRPETRLGLAVSRAVGNAVVRNRWKRLIREAFRRTRGRIPGGLDLIVRPRRGATPAYQAIGESLVRLTAQVARQLSRD